MMIGKFVIKSDAGGGQGLKTVNENVGDVICDDVFSADSATAIAKATEFDTFARAVTSLTTNTYSDAEVTVTKSINEILAE